MPSVPLPEQVPIQRAGWNPDFSGNIQLPNNDRVPVNPILSGLSQASTQAQTALQGAQTAGAVNDVQMKQRGMQASMLGALASLPTDQYEAQKATTIGAINKLNPSWQIDPNIDQQTARMNAMSVVPVQEQPIYGLNQQIPELMKQIQGGGQPDVMGGQPGSSPALPFANVDPRTLATMSAIPALKPVVDTMLNVQKTNQESPTGKNIAEANKNAIDATQAFGQVKASLGSLEDLIGKTDENGNFIPNNNLPQTRGVLTAEQRANLAQRFGSAAGEAEGYFGSQKTSDDYKAFSKLNESQTVKAIQALADSGQIKMTKTLENIVNRGYLVDPEASPTSKMQQAKIVETELENSMIAAQNVSKSMTGGQTQPMKSPLPQNAANQAQGALNPKQPTTNQPPLINTKAAFEALPSGTVYMESDGNKYRKP